MHVRMEKSMDLKKMVNRFYLDMVINELQLANYNHYQHVTYNSLLYLDIIAYKEKCTVSYIAEVLHVAKSAVTLKIKELEKLGLVEKKQSQQDKRVYYLYVNKKLLEEYKAYDRVLYAALDEIQVKYSKEDVENLCDMLGTINRHFQEEQIRVKQASIDK